MKKKYDYVPANRVSTKKFPRITAETVKRSMSFCFPYRLAYKDIRRACKEYDIRHSKRYKGFDYYYMTEVYGIAFLYKSEDNKVRAIQETCNGFNNINILREQIRKKVGNNDNGNYIDCSYLEETMWSAKEVMGNKSFDTLPCAFGLHRISETTSLVKVLDDAISVLTLAAFDPNSIYIGATEDQLFSQLTIDALQGKEVVYYPRSNKYFEAVDMKNRLMKYGLNIRVSNFMTLISFPDKRDNSDLSHYIWSRLQDGWEHGAILEEIRGFDPNF